MDETFPSSIDWRVMAEIVGDDISAFAVLKALAAFSL